MNNFTVFLLLILNNADLTNSHLYNVCENYNQLDLCIENPLCQWCNISNNNSTNSTIGICRTNTQCFYNNTACITNNNVTLICSLMNLFFMLGLLFILLFSILYVSFFTKNLLDNYFDIPNSIDGIRDRTKIKSTLLAIVNILLFSPLIIFWILDSIIFIYYYIFIMAAIILLSFSITTKKLYNYKKKKSYTQIN